MIQAALQYFQPSNYISRYGAGLIQADKDIQHSNNIDWSPTKYNTFIYLMAG